MMRRRLLEIPLSGDLYPVGTELLQRYIRSGDNPFVHGTFSANGEAIIDEAYTSYISITYIPINMNYTYQKNDVRMGLCFYDDNFNFISYTNYNNTSQQTFTDWPLQTKYIRVRANNTYTATLGQLFRIA